MDIRKHFQWLKQSKRTKYQCPDYAKDSLTSLSNYSPDEQAALDLRLNRVLVIHEKNLRVLYALADCHCIDTAVMSTAAFIFDRYLSRFIPNYVRGLVDVPLPFGMIGVASLFIASKSQLARRDLAFIEKFLRGNPHSKEILNVELKILVELDWNIVYTSPISIIHDFHAAIKIMTRHLKSSRTLF